MDVLALPREMHVWADRARHRGERIGFVPTMGYLHEGHISLVREAQRRTDRCVVSIFVNPLQFAPSEDLAHYPRDLERDAAQLRAAEVDVLYLPQAAEMYPEGFQTDVTVGTVTRGLCGTARPAHFRGVTTVVAKLFNAVKPHVAVFGMKDFQQLVAIRRMVADLDFDVEVVGAPIVREKDGLAMSSRNACLSPAERVAARSLSRALTEAAELARRGERRAAAVTARVRAVLAAEPLVRIDYVEMVDPETLQPVSELTGSALLALACVVGRTRLIDNTLLAAT